jgi:hypothetical protein
MTLKTRPVDNREKRRRTFIKTISLSEGIAMPVSKYDIRPFFSTARPWLEKYGSARQDCVSSTLLTWKGKSVLYCKQMQ